MSDPRLAVGLVVLVSLAAASPAAGYVRSTGLGGVPLAWSAPLVVYHVSSAASFPTPSCAPGPSGDPALAAVQDAFAAWRQECSYLLFLYGGQVEALGTGLAGLGMNLVLFRTGWCSANPEAAAHACFADPEIDCGGIFGCFEDTPGDQYLVALTTVIYDVETGRIQDADIELVGWDGQGAGEPFVSPAGPVNEHGWWFTCGDPAGLQECKTYGEAGCAFMDLQNTVTHEAGHVLGLAHPCEDTACDAEPALQATTMFPGTSPGDVEKRSLDPDDVAGLCAIYPAVGGCGCGPGGSPGALALLLAALAFRRRRGPPRR